LRDLASERNTITPAPGSIDRTIRRAMEAVQGRPEFRSRTISILAEGDMTGVFDPKKMERAFFNLLLNACEAAPEQGGEIAVDIHSAPDLFEIRVSDNGPGIPPSIRGTLFDAFVSSGKSNGTGLGLAIVSKIVHDHGGTIAVEESSSTGTIFLLTLPRARQVSDDLPKTIAT
jgi:signal transduction histidine kinase